MKGQIQQHENYNFHAELIQDLGKKVFFVQNNLILATRKTKRYELVQGELNNLHDMIIALNLLCPKTTLLKIELNLKLANIKYNVSDLEGGSNFLRRSFILIMQILKSNNLAFPKKFKAMTFKEYGEIITK